MPEGYRSRGYRQRICQDADKVEYAAVKRGSAVLSTGLVDAEISGALDDFAHDVDIAVQEAWQKRDLELESGISDIQSELQRRFDIMGSAYPFLLSDHGLRYVAPTNNLVYEFCLATSCAPSLTDGGYVGLPRIFERLATMVVVLFLGDGAGALHVGAPRDAAVGASFKEAMYRLNELTKEFVWDPETEYLAEDPATNGDEGVDFIAWKEPGDRRPGRLFILGQCACGSTVEDKYGDVNYSKFKKWFRPASVVEPMRAFAIPHHLADINLVEAQREAGIVFDRARLTIIAERASSGSILVPQITLRELIDLVLEAA